MSFTTITDDELVGLGVTGLDDTPELSTEDMQAEFDEYPQFLKDKFKTHITELEANTAAGDIGATIPEVLTNVTTEKVQPILNELASRAGSQASTITSHLANTSNPHSVTKAQVGLGNVDNTSDLNKPVSTAQQTAIDGVYSSLNAAKAPNDHASTATTYGTGNATKYGHVKLTDTYSPEGTPSAAASGVGASQKAVSDAYDDLFSRITHAGYGDMFKSVYDPDEDGKIDFAQTEGTLPINRGGSGLTSSPSMLTNLGSTSADTIMKASPRPGVTGTLPVGNGGTGLTSSPSMLTNLGSTTADTILKASPRPGVTGTLPVTNGGTGATTAETARTNLGAASATDVTGLIDNVNKRGCKNILRFPYRLYPYGNSLITVNYGKDNAGSLTGSGTASSDQWISLENNTANNDPYYLPAGKYVFYVKVVGDFPVTFSVRKISDSSLIASVFAYGNQVNTVEFELAEETNVRILGFGSSGIVFSGTAYLMLCDKSLYDIDTTWEPPAKSNQQLSRETTGLIDNTLENNCVNLIPYPYYQTSKVTNGITWTDNGDGTITANGTATETDMFLLYNYYSENTGLNPTINTDRRLKLTGCPTGGSSNTYYLQIALSKGSGVWQGGCLDSGSGAYMTPISGENHYYIYVFRIVILKGVTVSNLVFKPMVSLASFDLNYNDWVPYAKSNKELTEEVRDIAHGGTGANTAAQARTNLDVPATSDLNDYAKLTGADFTGSIKTTGDVNAGGYLTMYSGNNYRGFLLGSWNSTPSIKSTAPLQSNYGWLELCANSDAYGVATYGKELDVKNCGNTAFVPVLASAFTVQSSIRYKENVENLSKEDAECILKLVPVIYDYKKDSGIALEEDRYNHTGLIAEEAAEICPEIVTFRTIEDKSVPDSIDYSKLIPRMLKLLQMQENRIKELEFIVKNK